MKNNFKFVLYGILALSSSSCKESYKAPESIDLSFRFRPGASYKYQVDTRQVMDQHLMGLSIRLEQQLQIQSGYKVTREDTGIKTLEVIFDRIYIKSVNNDLALEYDSGDSAKQSPELRGIGDMANRPFTMRVDSNGAIRSVKAIEQARESAKVQPKTDALIIKGKLNDSTVRNTLQQLLNIYPGKAVKTGEGWDKKYTMNIGFMDMELDNHFKLVSVQENTAHIEVKSGIGSIPSNNPLMKTMVLKMKGTQTGTLDVDIRSGLIVKGELKQKISGSMKVNETEIPIEVTNTTHINGKEQ